MNHYRQGKNTRQAHKGIPTGKFEEEQGLNGFFGPVSHLIKDKPSTRWTNIEGPLKPHLFDLVKFNQKGVSSQRLLYNNHVEISLQWGCVGEELVAQRNADGDLCYFCHEGSGVLLTEYGLLHYKKGSYVIVPKCITHIFQPQENSLFFTVENKNSHYRQPDRGMVGRHAVYDDNALVQPCLETQKDYESKNNVEILKIGVKHQGEVTTFTYADHVFDTVGWKGDLYPYTLHVDHLNPLMSHRVHLPPSAHSTFVARDFVICTFLPRPLEEDKDALKVPFYHQNIDYDEVLFYHDGDFFSRDNLHAGMMTLHPAGFPHGPHPKAVEGIENRKRTDEYAVMIDSRWPLKKDESLASVEVANYWQSWSS